MKVLGYLKEHARPIVVVLVATIAIGATKIDKVGAGWVDDWLTSKTTTSGGYFEGQARGYATAGGFSARWPSRNDYLLSAQPPKLKVGCGGIDFFGGSLSFLDPDMLVQKLQNILTNSAFLAFDMALASLCPMCSNLMKSAEDLSNQLNSMAINDCNMAKGLTANLKPAFDGVKSALWADKGSAAINEGVSTSYKKYKDDIGTAASAFSMPSMSDIEGWWNQQKGKPQNYRETTSGCSGLLADMFPSDGGAYPVSVMDVIGRELGMPESHVDLMRGLVGDIVIDNAQKGYGINYVGGCSKNAELDLTQFQAGDIESMNKTGPASCTKATSTNGNLEQYVSKMMYDISDKLKTSTALLPAEENFIKNVPVAVLYGMRVGVGSGQSDTIVSSLSGITASAWTMKSLRSLLGRADSILRAAGQVNRSLVNGKSTCDLELHATQFKEEHEKMLKVVGNTVRILEENMFGQFKEFETTMTIAQRLEELNTQIRASVSRNFGASVAARAMRNM